MLAPVASDPDPDAVRSELEALPGVDCVHDLHARASGTTEGGLTAPAVTPARGGPTAALATTLRRGARHG